MISTNIQSREFLKIDIEDTGVGIEEADHQKLF
jgi:signal transduction histidine kinase